VVYPSVGVVTSALITVHRTVTDGRTPALPDHGEIGRGRDRIDIVNSKKVKGGNDQTYTIRRLKRDAPELAERVIADDL
jgi:hypothetical protein